MEPDLNVQSDELETLESIYATDFHRKDRNGGSINILCEGVEHPLQLTFVFPSDYPEIPPYCSFSSPLLKDFSQIQDKLTVCSSFNSLL
jgi:hypothetical protein